MPNVRTISVSGEAKQDIDPDQAILSFSLVSKDKDLNMAKKNNDEMADKVVAIIRGFKIPKEKIATSNINIAPQYNYQNVTGVNQQVFVGYNVSRSLRVTMDDISMNEKLLSALVEAKVDQINGVQFQLSDPEKYAAALRLKAYDNAKTKAAALAQAAGGKLGAPISISTGNISPMPIRPMLVRGLQAEALGASAPPEAPSLPGLISLQENVEVIFGLE